MSALQTWFFLLLLCALAARGLDQLRLEPADLGAMGATATLAILQRLVIGQVALDDVFFAPLILALPVVVAVRGGLRRGLAAAVGGWLTLVVLASALPVPTAGDIPQESFVLALLFAALTAGAAAAIPRQTRALTPWLCLPWLLFFATRDDSLVQSPPILGVVVLSVAWTYAGVFVPAPPSVPR